MAASVPQSPHLQNGENIGNLSHGVVLLNEQIERELFQCLESKEVQKKEEEKEEERRRKEEEGGGGEKDYFRNRGSPSAIPNTKVINTAACKVQQNLAWFIHSCNNYFLPDCCGPDTVLVVEDLAVTVTELNSRREGRELLFSFQISSSLLPL